MDRKIFKEIKILQPTWHTDFRGDLWTSYNKDTFPLNLEFKHDKFSKSRNNVLRGLHGDSKTYKLISCPYGEFYLVVVDNRKDSPTYLMWDSIVLSDKNKTQVLIPPNFANGHYCLSNECIFHYKLAYDGNYNDIENQFVIKWNDENIGIEWPTKNPILYGRDR